MYSNVLHSKHHKIQQFKTKQTKHSLVTLLIHTPQNNFPFFLDIQ